MPSPFFDRDAWRQWSEDIYGEVEARLPSPVLAHFGEDAAPTWIEWLEARILETTGQRIDLVAVVHALLLERFKGIRLIHATRLPSIDAVAQRGFVAWNRPELMQMAIERYAGQAEPARVNAAIDDAMPEHSAGSVYSFSALTVALNMFSEDDDGFIPEFAAGGGEFLRRVAVGLGDLVVPRLEVPTLGYLFACDLEWGYIDTRIQQILAQTSLITSLVATRLDPQRFRMVGDPGTIAVAGGIPAIAIAAYCETDALRDQPVRPEMLQWLRWPR